MASLKAVTLRTLGKLCSGMVEQNEPTGSRRNNVGSWRERNNRQAERMGPGPGSSHPAVSTPLKLLVMLIMQCDSISQPVCPICHSDIPLLSFWRSTINTLFLGPGLQFYKRTPLYMTIWDWLFSTVLRHLHIPLFQEHTLESWFHFFRQEYWGSGILHE